MLQNYQEEKEPKNKKELKTIIIMSVVIITALVTMMFFTFKNLSFKEDAPPTNIIEEDGSAEVDLTPEEVYRLCTLDALVCPGETGYEELMEKHAPQGDNATTTASYYDYELVGTWWSKSHRTTASRDFARGTMLEVTNLANGKSVEVLVNDYGPDEEIHPDRALDLSSYAFEQIGNKKLGTLTVEYREIGKSQNYKPIR